MTNPLTQQEQDWLHVQQVYGWHMQVEAASRGYNFAEGREARTAYLKISRDYETAHGERWKDDTEYCRQLLDKKGSAVA